MFCDYHTHTEFSDDSTYIMEDCVRDAIKIGMKEICFTDHVDYGIKYDEIYLKKNLRYFDAKKIPHFNEKTPEGIFNAEYDCCLDTVPAFAEEELINWIKEDD